MHLSIASNFESPDLLRLVHLLAKKALYKLCYITCNDQSSVLRDQMTIALSPYLSFLRKQISSIGF